MIRTATNSNTNTNTNSSDNAWGELPPRPDPVEAQAKEKADEQGDNSSTLTFDDMGLHDNILRGVYGMGFTEPSPVQQRAIPTAITGRDMVIQAQSGTGKTGAFGIATLQRLDPSLRAVQAIVLSPTRELAEQTRDVFAELGRHCDLRTHLTIGGASMRDDMAALRGGRTHVVCGTPGRIEAHLRSGLLAVDDLRVVVLDEADVMLQKDFLEQIKDILQLLPGDGVQILVVSATLPPEILDLTQKFLVNPHRVLVKAEQLTLQGLSQFYVACERPEWKADVLLDLYQVLSLQQTVIFCNTRRRVQELADHMRAHDFPVAEIHAELDGRERRAVMEAFRRGESRVLIATDIICRGIDVQQISMVINYELPGNREDYLHRIGRSARFGRQGVAINLVSGDREADKIGELERFYACEINEMPDPGVISGLLGSIAAAAGRA